MKAWSWRRVIFFYWGQQVQVIFVAPLFMYLYSTCKRNVVSLVKFIQTLFRNFSFSSCTQAICIFYLCYFFHSSNLDVISRTGKTLLAKTLARLVNVPFVIADATTLTQASLLHFIILLDIMTYKTISYWFSFLISTCLAFVLNLNLYSYNSV